MNIPLYKIFAFFIIVLFLGWMLYPRDFFLAYISEGQNDLAVTEARYLENLKKNPNHVDTVKKLASLYQKIGTPSKAYPYMDQLLNHRSTDWDFAEFYLDYVNSNQDRNRFTEMEVKIASRFLNDKFVKPNQLIPLLEDALQHTLWKQDTEQAYKVLRMLNHLNRDPRNTDYTELMIHLAKSEQNFTKIEDILLKQLKKNPNSKSTLSELVLLSMIQKDFAKAEQYVEEGLKLDPDDIPMLQDAIEVYTRMNNLHRAIQYTEQLLIHPNLTRQQIKLTQLQLAQLYIENRYPQKALPILENLHKEHPKDQLLFRDVISLLLDTKSTTMALSHLQDYHRQYPEDFELYKALVETHLYQSKDIAQLDLYQDYLYNTKRHDFALDVGYLFIEKRSYSNAVSWSQTALNVFPSSLPLALLQLDALDKSRQLSRKISAAEHFLKIHPRSTELILLALDGYYRSGRNQTRIKSLLRQLAAIKPRDYETIKMVAREFYFLSEYKEALRYFTVAKMLLDHSKPSFKQNQDSEKLEVNFYLAEVHQTQNQPKLARQYYLNAVEHSEHISTLDESHTQMQLKSKGRLRFDKTIERQYMEAIQHFPDAPYLRTDFADFLLRRNKIKPAQRVVEDFVDHFGEKHRDIIRYVQLSLSMAKQDWKTAEQLARIIHSANPNDISIKITLAETQNQVGQWRDAIRTLESLRRVSQIPVFARKLLREFHLNHDNRVLAKFDYINLGSGYSWISELGAAAHISKKIQLLGGYATGSHVQTGTSVQSHTGQLGMTYSSTPQFSATLGSLATYTPQRRVAGAFGSSKISLTNKLDVNLDAVWRKLRVDLPLATLNGTLEDKIDIGATFNATSKLAFASTYTFNRSYLPGGQHALTHNLAPLIRYVVLNKPHVSVSYQYNYSQVDDSGYLAIVPLIPKRSAHYISGAVSHDFRSNLSADAGFFVGEDTTRNLHAYEGDLFGFNAGMQWHATSWLLVAPVYSYGRENLSSVAGDYHQIQLQITGHRGTWIK